MATIDFQTLNNNDHSLFDPAVDVLSFLLATFSAADVTLGENGANLEVTAGGKTITLDATSLAQLSLANVAFADGSTLTVGDGSNGVLADWYAQSVALGASTTNNQARTLGGADVVQMGSGNDLLYGNVPFTPLAMVSQVGGVGSPTATSSPSISANGNLVAFAGGATIFGSTNNNGTDVFVKDLLADTVSNEHQSSGGLNGNSGSGSPVISADGSSLVFLSHSSNLVAGPASGTLYDIFKSDVNSSAIERVNTTAEGTLAADGRAIDPDLSSDGRYVTFISDSSNLAPSTTNSGYDVFVKDTLNGDLTRVSSSLTGGDGNGESTNAHISADGRYVVFQSDANNLTSNDTNGYADIFLFDRTDDSLINITGNASGTNLNNASTNPDVAFDNGYGGVVVFETAKSLVAADTHNSTDIYAYNIQNGSFKLVSATASGTGVGVSSADASISGDGRFVVFTGFSDSLVPGDTNGYADVFVKDLVTGAIALVSKAQDGTPANQASGHAEISLGGDWIVFQSGATNLDPADANGGFQDIFRVANPLLLDTLAGGAGDDSYVLERPDLIQEALNAGTDTVGVSFTGYVLPANVENLVLLGSDNLDGSGNSLNNLIAGNAGNNTMNGGTGIDTVSYELATGPVTVSLAVLANVAQDTGDGMDVLNGFENLAGSNFDDILTGSSGANAIDGGTGADQMAGGNGADTYYVDNVGDVVSETNATAAGGIDLVMSALDSFTLPDLVENGRILFDGVAALTGNSLANVLFAGPGDNVLNGAGGVDTASYQFATAAVTVSLAKAGAQATGGSGSDTLGGIENLAGSKYNDVLTGSAGNNLLRGLAGKDTLTGGKGKDIFVFDTAPNSSTNLDKITDFSVVDDTIQLENGIFTRFTKTGALATANFYPSAAGTAHDANDYLCYNTKTGVLSYDSDGTGHLAPIKIATVFSSATAHPALTFADFLVI